MSARLLVAGIADANLRQAIRWLQISYTSAFHGAHWIRRHLFQGRFRSVLIEDLRGVVEVYRKFQG
ncbi:MAG TPA: hypothetical protein P5186_20945 [Candidatus Paceibacterota bacterium]|nr:hypothetical protein [Verrucomicrobiota bacterium]HRY50525.1 hypothetical protein [Candidatus Paceibacterota bacterium]HSA02898.1 hypothetical protein [Candidatus Paceibacterota bacterium]